jgi:hypothetical protein
MTEAQSTQPVKKPRKPSYWHILGMSVGILVFPAIFTTARNTSIWPDAVVGFVTFGIPFLLIGFRSWNRWFHPDRTPVHWQKGSFLNKHHDALELLLNVLWCPLFGFALFLDEHRHFKAKLVSYFLVYGCQGWLSLLKLSTAGRKYIPPPSAPYDPSKYKPLQSEHWGGREAPMAGTSEA